MKTIPLILCMVLLIGLLSGCSGTAVVYYSDCTCPVDVQIPESVPTEQIPSGDGMLKTGMAVSTSVKKSASADSNAEGKADFDVTMVAVLVDDNGVIHECIIDGISSSVSFDDHGTLTCDVSLAPKTKNELGADYGMVAWGGAVAEWDAQAASLADFAVGKTVSQLRSGAVSESGYAPDGTDLATSATIYLGGYVAAIEAAVQNASHLGARTGDVLKMAAITLIDDSVSADSENPGNAQLNMDVAALTVNGETITSCVIDSLQAKVAFDHAGKITSDLSAPVATKNELGASYGMVAYGGAIAEWNEQAAAFANYVTGKTAAEVAGIAITEATKPADADLAASVTISILGFQNLISKAAQ